MKHNRFAIRKTIPGFWTVFDVFTGRPATLPEGSLPEGYRASLPTTLLTP